MNAAIRCATRAETTKLVLGRAAPRAFFSAGETFFKATHTQAGSSPEARRSCPARFGQRDFEQSDPASLLPFLPMPLPLEEFDQEARPADSSFGQRSSRTSTSSNTSSVRGERRKKMLKRRCSCEFAWTSNEGLAQSKQMMLDVLVDSDGAVDLESLPAIFLGEGLGQAKPSSALVDPVDPFRIMAFCDTDLKATGVSPVKGGVQVRDEAELEGDFLIGDVVGEGAFATVRTAVCTGTGKRFAVRSLKMHHDAAEHEYILPALVQDDGVMNCIRIYATNDDAEESRLHMVYPLAEHGDLLDYLMSRGALDDDELRDIFRAIFKDVAACHEAGVAHLDLKPENFLLFEDEKDADEVNLVLTDFGSAHYVESTCPEDELLKLVRPAGSYSYISPESLNGKFCFKSDSWSLGIMMAISVAGKMPEPVDPANTSGAMNVKELLEDENIKALSSEAQDLMHALLQHDHSSRVSVRVACQHPFFHDVIAESDGAREHCEPLQEIFPFTFC